MTVNLRIVSLFILKCSVVGSRATTENHKIKMKTRYRAKHHNATHIHGHMYESVYGSDAYASMVHDSTIVRSDGTHSHTHKQTNTHTHSQSTPTDDQNVKHSTDRCALCRLIGTNKSCMPAIEYQQWSIQIPLDIRV